MKAFLTTLVAALTIGSFGLPAENATACGGYKGGFGYSHKSYGFGYGYKNYGYKKYAYNSYYRRPYVRYKYAEPVYDQCYQPCYSSCYVLPNDTWYTLADRVYGDGSLGKHIASYNGLGYDASLPVGGQLNLPVINNDGTFAASSAAAAPANFGQPTGLPGQGVAPQGQPSLPQVNAPAANPAAGQNFAPNTMPTAQPSAAAPQPATPAANIRVATPEESFPSVAMGSILMLDGQQLGNEAGMVRMRISGLALPVKVLDWNDQSAKIQLPQLDLAKAIQARIEVMRADGSLASKSTINLTPAATRLALGN